MALCGTVTVTTGGAAVAFSSDNENFRATALYFYNLTAGNSLLVDIATTSGASTGFTIPPSTLLSFPNLGGTPRFSVVASSAAGSASLSYLASR
jgi:hypothetical protein